MNYSITQADMEVLRQPNLSTYIKLELLNKSFLTIGELSGEMIDGSHNVDSGSDIRTTGSIRFIVNDSSYLTKEDSKIWIDKYVRLYIGVLHQRSQQILWYRMGVFLFNENTYTYDATTRTLSVSIVDLMAKLTGLRSGQVKGLKHTIEAGNDIREVMISTLTEGGESFEYIIDELENEIPYDLSFGTGATVSQIIGELRDLYPGLESYFNDTVFICKKIPTCIDDDIVLDAKTIAPLVTSESLSNSFSNVKNVTDIWGKCIEADRYADMSTNTGTRYNITLEDYTLSYGDKIGFKTNISIMSPTLKINSETAFPIVNGSNEDIILQKDTSYVVKYMNGKFYLQGEYQIHYIVKEFSTEPSAEFKEQDIINEGTHNIKYIINPDSPFAVDKIGEIRQVLSGGDYDNIYTEDLCLQRAEYENWIATRLQDSITLNMIMIPWLEVNKKIEYTSNVTNRTDQYIIKSINRNLSNWTMSVQMIKFYPLYPFIIEG